MEKINDFCALERARLESAVGRQNVVTMNHAIQRLENDPHRFVFITGRSGTGKSHFANLLQSSIDLDWAGARTSDNRFVIVPSAIKWENKFYCGCADNVWDVIQQMAKTHRGSVAVYVLVPSGDLMLHTRKLKYEAEKRQNEEMAARRTPKARKDLREKELLLEMYISEQEKARMRLSSNARSKSAPVDPTKWDGYAELMELRAAADYKPSFDQLRAFRTVASSRSQAFNYGYDFLRMAVDRLPKSLNIPISVIYNDAPRKDWGADAYEQASRELITRSEQYLNNDGYRVVPSLDGGTERRLDIKFSPEDVERLKIVSGR